mmetsp:Transcript_33510/g.51481  ORF Transcript_33510/g.51481 Transcript_33510/m.51481 type:complete len:185 (-) Transcript_33510:129-683(-)|eukprot:CAMPEP_0170495086 /NCGR_PEP_ID=MMETSP0208-20121228/15010_1 /TAXON_ID=197538 /ORGANISM="Strombidium inclinatum, Strain S3" /LENGTH=184 /DNA_ID=CAMNT_0010771227 /DNA_START=188 /DNA_END=742 /DNA_ORIENTATION=-
MTFGRDYFSRGGLYNWVRGFILWTWDVSLQLKVIAAAGFFISLYNGIVILSTLFNETSSSFLTLVATFTNVMAALPMIEEYLFKENNFESIASDFHTILDINMMLGGFFLIMALLGVVLIGYEIVLAAGFPIVTIATLGGFLVVTALVVITPVVLLLKDLLFTLLYLVTFSGNGELYLDNYYST